MIRKGIDIYDPGMSSTGGGKAYTLRAFVSKIRSSAPPSRPTWTRQSR